MKKRILLDKFDKDTREYFKEVSENLYYILFDQATEDDEIESYESYELYCWAHEKDIFEKPNRVFKYTPEEIKMIWEFIARIGEMDLYDVVELRMTEKDYH